MAAPCFFSSPSSSSPLKLIPISLLLLSYTFFLLFFPPPHPLHLTHFSFSSKSPRRGRILLPQSFSSQSSSHCGGDPPGLLNYAALHFCLLSGDLRLSLPSLSLLLLLHFRLLASAASLHFSPAVSRLAARLRLSPSMAAVTLLSLGNGAPDAFASAAALRGGLPRTGLAAILSAGTFVSAFVVGAVTLLAAPFPLDPAPFVRDVFFYLVASSALFYIYLSAEIFLWQAVGFILFYLFFVGFVFYMDLAAECNDTRGREVQARMVDEKEACGQRMILPHALKLETKQVAEDSKSGPGFCGLIRKITKVWEVPITVLLKLTIPSSSRAEWNRFYVSANIALCPLILLYSLSSFVALDSQIVFFLPRTRFPLWSIILFVSLCLALYHFIFEKEPPETEWTVAITLISFMMSVFWISTMAGELLNCLTAIGSIMNFPPAILGLTVLAWGNSVGDLVADVALAKAGQPAMAMAGCFAGPMFNMLVGLGTAFVVQTARVYPKAYELQFNIGIVVAFVFLLCSLMGSLLVITWYGFRVPRFWGYCLVGLYVLFTAAGLALARLSG
ncbi:cation/calcium exchanger 5 [Ananas comosus]|uniref:Cation/calcium exchanger 5 n=1 Tax=Ananas comosus TaxID=4615 RepID=A0A6P5G0S3_ANACO|nr:cation/calcium exchanger 5 [Ananas comosus]